MSERPRAVIDLAHDSRGNAYTDHAFGFKGDPWRGATILTPGVVLRLKAEGEWPLAKECP